MFHVRGKASMLRISQCYRYFKPLDLISTTIYFFFFLILAIHFPYPLILPTKDSDDLNDGHNWGLKHEGKEEEKRKFQWCRKNLL